MGCSIYSTNALLLNQNLLQYPEGHVSRSIYAIFKLVSASPSSGSLINEFLPNLGLAIWTTTPWTVPANAGILTLRVVTQEGNDGHLFCTLVQYDNFMHLM